MTNDFHLFPDPAGDAGAIDPDVAFVSAYLARELSPMQVLAIESRLATDSAFRAAMQPLLDAWATVIPSLEGGAATRVPDATAVEVDAGWQRYTAEPDATRIPPLERQAAPERAHSITPRRKTMTRIAAAVALIVLPVVALAEVAVYAANHPGTPGHAFAQSIVPRSLQTQPGRPMGEIDVATHIEGPVAQALTIARGQLQRADSVDAAAVVARLPERAKPDRARIAALAREHHAAFVRGDTAMDYIVMVLDVTEKYVWSTVGIGNVAIEVGGDSRTMAERTAYDREFAAELSGSSRGAQLLQSTSTGRNQPLYVIDGVPVQSPQADSSFLNLDIESIQVIRGAAAAAAYGSRAAGGVISISTRGGASTASRSGGAGGRGRAGGLGADTSLARSAGARGAVTAPLLSPTIDPSGATDPYVVGSRGLINILLGEKSPNPRTGQVMPVNTGPGLRGSGRGESGIEGLPSASVSYADAYVFGANELAPRLVRIFVVHLTPGSTWKGR